MKKIIFLSIGLLLLISSCRQDEIIQTTPEVTVNPGILEDYVPTVIPITSSVDGFVTDESGDPIVGAAVKLATKTTVTNKDGHFAFLNAEMNKAGTLIQVEAPGFFDGSRRFMPVGTGVDRVRIQLLQKVFDQSIDAATGGSVSIPGGTGTIEFKPNGIIDAAGNAYTGMVDIAVKYLDPSEEITSQQMPGDLFGVDQELEERMLATYGMVAVELADDNGNPLNLGENSTATISMPVPSSILGRAPSTIPLWYYNEDYGVWVEEGKATLTNGVYIGEVTHFSWWNCDDPFPSVTLKMTVEDQNGNPLPGYMVSLASIPYGFTHGFTNSQGIVAGLIPSGEVLVARVFACNANVLHTQNIGPFTNALSTVSITVNTSAMSFTSITGTAVCNGAPLNDYLLKVNGTDFSEYVYGSTSNINWDRLYCGTPGSYTAKLVNPSTLEESNSIPVTSGISNNVGTIDACLNNLSNYILLNFDGNTHLLIDSISTGINVFNTNETYIYTYDSQTGISFDFRFDGVTAGSYPAPINDLDISYPSTGYYGNGSMTTNDVTTYTTDKIIGTFSGTVVDNAGTTKPVSVSYDIDR